MMFKKNAVHNNESLTETLKKEAKKRWKCPKVMSAKCYNKMVEEAVAVITANWKNKVKHSTEFQCPVKEAEIVAYKTFFITDELELASDSIYALDYNWKTGKSYFSDLVKFESKEMADKFVNDVLSRLPKDTVCSTYISKKSENTYDTFDGTSYSFTLKLNLQ